MQLFPWFGGLALALVAVPAAARDIDVFRPGDDALSCKALSAEMNDLLKRQAKARRKAEGGGGTGMFATLNRFTKPMLDGVVSQTGGATMAAADGTREVLDSAASAEAERPQPAAASGQSLVDQRLARLTGFHTAKRC